MSGFGFCVINDNGNGKLRIYYINANGVAAQMLFISHVRTTYVCNSTRFPDEKVFATADCPVQETENVLKDQINYQPCSLPKKRNYLSVFP
jgi:hypothetical protein